MSDLDCRNLIDLLNEVFSDARPEAPCNGKEGMDEATRSIKKKTIDSLPR